MILGEMFVLSFIFICVAVCKFYAVPYVSVICSCLLFYNYSAYFFLYSFMFVFYFVYSLFCIILCIISPFVYSCLLPIFVQLYRPLPSAGNRIAVNKCHIVSYHIISLYKNILTCLFVPHLCSQVLDSAPIY
jgi:hypothetical protein